MKLEPILSNIIQGDCLEVMKRISDSSIDAIICDPPYGTTACKWDTIIPFEPMWEQLKRVTKKNGAIVLFGSQPFTSALVMSNPKMFKYAWVWEKQKASNFMSLKYQPAKYHEDILVFGQGKINYYPIKWRAEKQDMRKTVNNPAINKESHYGNIIRIRNKDDGTRYPKSILKFDKRINKNVHPTQKPVALMEYLIKTYTNEGETVLDFTMGVGTTGIACRNLNRDFIGIEISDKYCSIARELIQQDILL